MEEASQDVDDEAVANPDAIQIEMKQEDGCEFEGNTFNNMDNLLNMIYLPEEPSEDSASEPDDEINPLDLGDSEEGTEIAFESMKHEQVSKCAVGFLMRYPFLHLSFHI